MSKASESTDWESRQSKYADMLQLFKQQYPKKEEAPKMIILIMLKRLQRASYQQNLRRRETNFARLLILGKKSGNGRVVLLYFELCEQRWGGYPATNILETGTESSEVLSDEANVDVDIILVGSTKENAEANTTDSRPEKPSSESSFQDDSSDLSASRSSTVKERRDKPDARLKGQKARETEKKAFS